MPAGNLSGTPGNVRVRACGLIASVEGLLLANHPGLYGHDFWLPPGGRVEFGSSMSETVIREIREECNLTVTADHFRFACSVRRGQVHAVEFFFLADVQGGALSVGHDPERGENQIISDVRFIPFSEIARMPRINLHPVFSSITEPSKIMDLTGFLELS